MTISHPSITITTITSSPTSISLSAITPESHHLTSQQTSRNIDIFTQSSSTSYFPSSPSPNIPLTKSPPSCPPSPPPQCATLSSPYFYSSDSRGESARCARTEDPLPRRPVPQITPLSNKKLAGIISATAFLPPPPLHACASVPFISRTEPRKRKFD